MLEEKCEQGATIVKAKVKYLIFTTCHPFYSQVRRCDKKSHREMDSHDPARFLHLSPDGVYDSRLRNNTETCVLRWSKGRWSGNMNGGCEDRLRQRVFSCPTLANVSWRWPVFMIIMPFEWWWLLASLARIPPRHFEWLTRVHKIKFCCRDCGIHKGDSIPNEIIMIRVISFLYISIFFFMVFSILDVSWKTNFLIPIQVTWRAHRIILAPHLCSIWIS